MFRSECELILYLLKMYVNFVYHIMSKIPKQLPNCLKNAETSVALFIVNGILWEVNTYTVIVSYGRYT